MQPANATAEPEPLLLTAPETARTLRICRRTLHSWTKSGDIPCVRLGARVMYDPRDLRQMIDRLKSGGAAVDG